MSLSKKTRFEVFKRDSFTCQYCGKKAPDVVLHVDHVKPQASGGTDDMLNLVTACVECNQGKKHRELSDDSVVAKQRRQLEDLQERREQIEMMMEWQRSLVDLDESTVDSLCAFWEGLAPGFITADNARRQIGKWLRQFGLNEVAEAMRIAASQYLEFQGEGQVTEASWDLAFHRVGGIMVVRQRERDDPDYRVVAYSIGILRKRLSYVRPDIAREWVECALSWGATDKEIYRTCSRAHSWSAWQEMISDLVANYKGSGGGSNAT